MADPRRGDIWLGSLDPTVGNEQAGKRPLLIVSDDRFNAGRSGLVIVMPITKHFKNIPFHVALNPPEGGLKVPSFIECEDVRSISRERLQFHLGSVYAETLAAVEDRLRLLLTL